MTRKPAALPDLDDDAEFRRRMSPLVDQTVPLSRRSAQPEGQKAGEPDIRNNGSRIEAARRQAMIEAARGMKRRFEYLIPDRVGRALAEDAASQGKSATARLLEVLRDAGYPVIDEDLVDLRKMPKR
jgi:hypothetical protein